MHVKRIIMFCTGGGLLLVMMPLSSGRFLTQPRSSVEADNGTGVRPPSWIVAAGQTEPASQEVRVASGVAGQLEWIAVQEGDFVARGQTIATIAHDDLRADLEAAEARLQIKEAEFRRLMNGALQEERQEIWEGVLEAQAVVKAAEAQESRLEVLYSDGLTSRADLEQAQRELKVSEARLNAARDHHALISAVPREEERSRAQAEVDLARANVDEARAKLEQTRVHSPISGTVLRRFRNTGERVTPPSSADIVTIADLTRCRVRTNVDETDIARVRFGQRAYVTAGAYGEQQFWGRIVRVSHTLGPNNLHGDDPSERQDTTVLETLVELDEGCPLPVGLRVKTFIRSDD